MRRWLVRWVVRAAILWAAERLARKVAEKVGEDKPRPQQVVAGDSEVTAEAPAAGRLSISG